MKKVTRILMILFLLIVFSSSGFASTMEKVELENYGKRFIEEQLSHLAMYDKENSGKTLESKKLIQNNIMEDYLNNREKYMKAYENLYNAVTIFKSREYQNSSIEFLKEDIAIAKFQTLEMWEGSTFGEKLDEEGGVYDYTMRFEKKNGQWTIVEAYSNDDFTQALIPAVVDASPEVNRDTPLFSTMSTEKLKKTVDMEISLKDSIQNMQNIYKQDYVNIKEDTTKSINEITPFTGANRKLNPTAMRNYQDRWWNAYNPRWGNFTGLGGDCTNYVSQVLNAGGAPLDPTGSYRWYYYNMNNTSDSWAGVNELRNYLIGNTYTGPEGSY